MESLRPDVSVIVVSYNAVEWLSRCLAAVTGHGALERTIEVIVLDNASDAPTREFLTRRPHGVTVIQSQENLGFGRACNRAVAVSTGRHVLLLNPDAVVEPGAVDAMVAFLETDPGCGMVGGRTVQPDGSLNRGSCWGAPTLWSMWCSAVGLSRIFRHSPLFDPESLGRWQRDSPREVDIITGCLLMASREAWDRLGGFDERFFMYGEDADLCLRAWEAGFRPSITPDAVAMHAFGASSPQRVGRERLLIRGKATLVRKRWSGPRRWMGLHLLSAGIGVRALAEAVRHSPDTTMRTLWRERGDWIQGWAPVVGASGSPGVAPTPRADQGVRPSSPGVRAG